MMTHSKPDPISIVVADDHPLFRAGVVAELESMQACQVVGEAENGRQALDLVTEHQPKIVILDVMMPEITGLEVAREINTWEQKPSIILLTMYDEPSMFNAALECGVMGYVLKDAAVQDICKAVRTVAQGNYYFSADFSGALVKRAGLAQKSQTTGNPSIEKLTAAETALLQLVAEIKSNDEIAQTLFISKRTVENHKVNIARKLGIKGHNALLKFALQHKSQL